MNSLITRFFSAAVAMVLSPLLFGILVLEIDPLFDMLFPSMAPAARAALVLLSSGVAVGLVLAWPTIKLFGKKLGAMVVALSGLPVALLSLPPHAEAVAANGGWVSMVGAGSCTLVAALAVLIVASACEKFRRTTRQP